MSGKLARALALVVLLGVAGFAGTLAVQKVSRQREALAVCDAAAAGRWSDVLAGSQLDPGAGETGRAIVECRCRAWIATGRSEACTASLDRVLAQAESRDWVPAADLSVHLLESWLRDGRTEAAARFAQRAGAAYPEDSNLFYLEMSARTALEEENRVLLEMEERVRNGGAGSLDMGIQLAHRYVKRGQTDRALAILGEAPPDARASELGRWFDARAGALAMAGEAVAAEKVYRAWRAAGGDTREVNARMALTLSVSGLEHPDFSTLSLLRTAVEAGGLEDAKLHEALVVRLILTLVASDAHAEALSVYEHFRERFELAGLSKGELLRSSARNGIGERGASLALRFSLDRALPGGVLLVSPELDASVDQAYEAFPIAASGPIVVARRPGVSPARWVVRDAAGNTRASGTVNLFPGALRDVRVEVGEAIAPSVFDAAQPAGDGRRRVFVLVPDCGDWPTYQYLRTRGELPVFESLVTRGYSAVLTSDPPFTAAAMEALVWPDRRGGESFVGSVHQLGVEIAGLASVGRNPFGALRWVLPEVQNLFDVVGAGDRVAANMLFSHGKIEAGRHGQFVGPGGQMRDVPVAKTYRALTPDELGRFPGLAQTRDEADRPRLEIIAAELDAAVEIARAGEVDLTLLRVEPLDIVTHAHFADAAEDGQDDGARFLFAVYRYLDARMGELYRSLDRDDVLIVLSDHGIRTAMEHSNHAVFVATGAGVPVGRAAGTPHLRGVPRVLAELLGVETLWPDTQVAAWATQGRSVAQP